MSKIYILFLISLLFVSIENSGKKSEKDVGVFTRLPDNKNSKRISRLYVMGPKNES